MTKSNIMKYLDEVIDEETNIMKYLDEVIDEITKKREFMNCCPCCGKPLIIKRDGIYYSVREFEDIDFDEKETVDK